MSPASLAKSALLVLVAVLILTGCESHDEGVGYTPPFTVELDDDTNTVDLPLDAYVLREAEAMTVERANVILLADCMEERGLPYPRSNTDWAHKPPSPDLYFGLWSEAYAESWGYDFPVDPNSAAINQREAELSDGWWTSWDSCVESVTLLPLSVMFSTSPEGLADTGRRQALKESQADPAWIGAREEWVRCVKKNGLTVDGDQTLRPEVPDRKLSTVFVATRDAACNRTTSLAVRLSDIQAKNEMRFIAKHEDDLNQVRRQSQAVLADAESIVAAAQ